MMDTISAILEFPNGEIRKYNKVHRIFGIKIDGDRPINIYLFGKVSKNTLHNLRFLLTPPNADNIYMVNNCDNVEYFRINEFNHEEAKMERLIGLGELTYD